MYTVSDTFRAAMNDFVIRSVLRGNIDGVPFTHDDILKDSFRCCNQCIAVNDAKLGGVFVGEIRLTLLDTIANTRGDWLGRVIECEYGLITETGAEYIPCPSRFYTIYSADWTEQGLKVVAYDNMIKLEKTFEREISSGSAWAWLQYISRKTGILIGQTETEVNTMPNAMEVLGIDSADKIETYRDLVSYLAATLAGFATIDRRGALIIKQFDGEVVATIDPDKRFTGASFSDYTTKYTGLSVVNNSDSTVSYYHTNPDDGLTMKLGANPFLQLGLVQENIRNRILNALGSFVYVPFKATLLGCCAYDLGDLIRFTGGIAVNSTGCIMSFDFGLNSYSIACYGDNPALENVQTKTDKNITGLTKSKASEQLAITNLTNIDKISIATEWKEVGSIAFSVNKKQIILFNAVSKMNLQSDGNVQYKYTLNDNELDFVHDIYAHSGTDTATLFIPFGVEADLLNTFKVYARSGDTTGTIEALNVRGSILGVGINISEFDGTISLFDTFSQRIRGEKTIHFVDGGAVLTEYIPEREGVADVFELRLVGGLGIDYEDNIRITLRDKEFRRVTEDGSLRLTEDGEHYRRT